MQIVSKHTFRGMDNDTADRFLPAGRYRFALNIHIGSSEDNNVFSVENVRGNSVVNYSLPSGNNSVIGSYEDIVNKCVYYFLCNSSSLNILSTSGVTVSTTTPHGLNLSDLVEITGISGRSNILGKWIIRPTASDQFEVLNPLTYLGSSYQESTITGTSGMSGRVIKYRHSILKYDSVTNSISLVYQHSRLNLNEDFPVTGAALISDVLHWTDGYNPPRSLMLSEVANYGTFFIEPMLDFIRIPPTKQVSVFGQWINSEGTVVPYLGPNMDETNFMNDKSYQFIYRYAYKDESRSVWSPVSEMQPTGFPDAKNNIIYITVANDETTNYLYFSKVIKSIEIAYREETSLNFKYIDRIDFPQATSVTYIFKNDHASAVIDASETSHFFDLVPDTAGSLASVQNRVFMGDCTEGFDVNQHDFSIATISYGGAVTNNMVKWKAGSPYEIGIQFYDRADRSSGVYKLGRVTMPTLLENPNAEAPRFTISGTPPIWATHYRILRTENLEKNFFIQGYALLSVATEEKTEILFNTINGELSYTPSDGDILVLSGNATSKTKYKVLSISADQFGNSTIVVKGKLPITNDSLFLVEIYSPAQSVSQLYYETPNKYQIYLPGSDQRAFFPPGSSLISLDGFSSGDVYRRKLNDTLANHARVIITVNQIFLIPNVLLKISINNDVYTGGTFVTGSNMTELLVAQLLVAKINNSQKLYKAFIFFSGSDLNSATPERNTQAKFIVYDTRKGSDGAITITNETIVNVGDIKAGVYVAENSTVSGVAASTQGIVEAMNCNDRFSNWDKNTGRASIVLQDGNKRLRRKTIIRFGGKYITDTKINNVSSFYFADQEELTNAGAVRKLILASNNQSEGTVLLAVQESEITSLYIGQVVLKNSGSGENIVASDKVIGSANPLQKLVGTVNPESVVQHNGMVYGFDALRGIVWRYGQDGLTFISEQTGGGSPAGMRNFFYDASDYLVSLGSFKCYAGFDPYNNEYLLTIPSADAEKSTVAWSEKLNVWTSFMSFIGEWYQKVNTKFISFKNGRLWLHRSNETFNNFYGVQYDSKLLMICNIEPMQSKMLQVVEEIANGSQWDCSDIGTPRGQSSELIGLYDKANPGNLPADFKQYENRYSGNVMRDKNTPNMLPSDYPLLCGDVMRSDVFSILLLNDKTTKQNLYEVDLYLSPSFKMS